MIGFNGTYLPAASHGNMRITAASIGGQWVMAPWHIAAATQQAIIAAFGAEEGIAVITKTNDYLNAIALTDTTRAQQLSAFINEDPLLVCSLVETSKTRWLVGDGKAYIDSGVNMLPGYSLETYLQILRNKDNLNFAVGSYAAGNRYTIRTRTTNNGVWIQFVNGTGGELADNEFNPHKVIMAEGTCYIDDTEYSNNLIIRDNGFSMYLFSCNGLAESGNTPSIAEAKISYAVFRTSTDQVANFIPHLRPNGESGMLDIVSFTFYPNANTEGAFTIAITDKTPA